VISSQNYAGSKQKLYKIIIIQIFAIWDKAKPNTENVWLKLDGGQVKSQVVNVGTTDQTNIGTNVPKKHTFSW
jgi:hypothetical protein